MWFSTFVVPITIYFCLPDRTLAWPNPGEPHHQRRASVSVTIDTGTIVGQQTNGVESFNGIPFAEPPTGSRRLRPPERLSRNIGTFNTPALAAACPQMFISTQNVSFIEQVAEEVLKLPFFDPITGQEDCLTVSVQRPAGTKSGDLLPVLFWIFGGAFEIGSTQLYDASNLIRQGAKQGQPFVYVAVNYRVGGFGFLPGAEILKDGSANLGLLDQRMGLEWVADNIEQFGGDRDRVTIWGQSAGSISVMSQALLYGGNAMYKGKPLFRSVIASSGTTLSADPVDCPKAQGIYNEVVTVSGCDGSGDSLRCLRNLPYEKFLDAVNSFPSLLSLSTLSLPYVPRPDGSALPNNSYNMLRSGQYLAVPTILGAMEDEGTLFSLLRPPPQTTDSIAATLTNLQFSHVNKSEVLDFVDLYPGAPSAGSPFGTGIFNELYPGFKRFAAVVGDAVFTLTRRIYLPMMLQSYPDTPIWSYYGSFGKGTPFLGTFHGDDILLLFFGDAASHTVSSGRTYIFNFMYNLDPNKGVTGGLTYWPQWKDGQNMLWFKSVFETSIIRDDFRAAAYSWLSEKAAHLRF